MAPERTPLGMVDRGDDAYGNSIIEAARYIQDGCTQLLNKGGTTTGFSKSPPS